MQTSWGGWSGLIWLRILTTVFLLCYTIIKPQVSFELLTKDSVARSWLYFIYYIFIILYILYITAYNADNSFVYSASSGRMITK